MTHFHLQEKDEKKLKAPTINVSTNFSHVQFILVGKWLCVHFFSGQSDPVDFVGKTAFG